MDISEVLFPEMVRGQRGCHHHRSGQAARPLPAVASGRVAVGGAQRQGEAAGPGAGWARAEVADHSNSLLGH